MYFTIRPQVRCSWQKDSKAQSIPSRICVWSINLSWPGQEVRLGCWRGKVTSSRKDSVFWGRKAKTACHSLGTHRICKFSNTYKKEEWKQMKWRFMLTEVKLWRAWYFLHDFWAVGQWSKMPFRNITLVVKCEGQTRWGDLEDQTLVKNENEDFDDTKKPDNELSFHWIVNARKFLVTNWER